MPEAVREVGQKRKVVGGVPFETGVPDTSALLEKL